MKKTGKFVELELRVELGLLNPQSIKIGTSGFGEPKPLVAFDFDGTLFEGWRTYHQAAERLVMVYSSDSSKIPSADHFKFGVHPDLHSWGVPERVSLDDAWETFISLIIKIEKRNPCRLFPSIPSQLRKIADKFHLVIVTINSIHPVADIIKRDTGLDVDVIVVEDKAPVLAYLARWHNQHHAESGTPFYYFGDTEGDMRAASAAQGLVYPVAVTTHEIRNNIGLREWWQASMSKGGARAFAYHNRILDVIKGKHRINPMLF